MLATIAEVRAEVAVARVDHVAAARLLGLAAATRGSGPGQPGRPRRRTGRPGRSRLPEVRTGLPPGHRRPVPDEAAAALSEGRYRAIHNAAGLSPDAADAEGADIAVAAAAAARRSR